jgi:putative DNA primase/helicase
MQAPSVNRVTLEDLTTRFRGPAKRTGNRTMVFCPGHDDVNRQSLALGQGVDGRLLVHCHAGCKTETVLDAVGLQMKDLFPSTNGRAPQPHQGPRHPVATYGYTDGAGELLYQVVRYEPKAFKQRRPDEGFGWIWNLGDVRRVLYRLPHLAEQPRVFWTEGEKEPTAWQVLDWCPPPRPWGRAPGSPITPSSSPPWASGSS